MGRGRGGNAGSNRPANSKGGKEKYQAPEVSVKTDVAARKDTEAGLSENLKRVLLAREAKTRDFKVETLDAYDADGNLIAKARGGETSVKIPFKAYRPNLMITHNHPDTNYGESSFAGIGTALSPPDMANAVRLNHIGVRAVSKHYTYTILRPKGGWNANPKEVRDYGDAVWNSLYSRFKAEHPRPRYGASKAEWSDYKRAYDRFDVTASHEVTKAVAKKFGFIYRRRRSR